MKILIICTSVDNYLKKQIKALQLANHNIDLLNIIEYKMKFDNGKIIHIRPKTKFKILEYFFISDEINEYYRRKELFEYLDSYDIVHIYKCCQYTTNIKEEIESISLKYVITINNIIPRKNMKLEEFFKNAKAIFFQNDRLKQSFNYLYNLEDRTKTIYEPIELLYIYENIDDKILKKFKEYLAISSDKIAIFCHFQGSRYKQQELIISLANLPIEIKKLSTFLLYFDNDDDSVNNNFVNILKEIKLDYVIIKNSATKEQVAMLLKISSASIFINHSPLNSILITSIYAQNHPFLYKAKDLDYVFKNEKIFLDDFSEFYFFFNKIGINEGLFQEIYKKNREKIEQFFSYKSFEENFIEATLK
jgi:hypothetical protein